MYESSNQSFSKAEDASDIVLDDIRQFGRKPADEAAGKSSFTRWLSDLDIAPDLGEQIGSARWFRGLGTFSLLTIGAFALLPDFGPLYGAQPPLPSDAEFDEARAQMIMPIAFGSDSGRRMAATDNVVALAASPERPRIQLTAALGRGDSFSRVLQRAGVSSVEASRATSMVAGVTPLSDIAAGTPINITLGKRTARKSARPLEALAFRARFDLNLELTRAGGGLQIKRLPIRVDATPLRIRGKIGNSLYRSARAAGAPSAAVQQYLKIVSGHTSLSRLAPTDEFDIIVDYRRAETGEVQSGKLLYAGVERGGKPKLQLLKWKGSGGTQWFEASGVGKSRGQIGRPVNARISSRYGMRRHPILRYKRMHAGLDFAAPTGTPIYAVTDGSVSAAGRMGGCGKAVKLKHAGSLATRYCHMSRIRVRSGQNVRRGQIIGYVGSTGMSTGPHLHYEVYRNGRHINPESIKFATRAQLEGQALANFRSRIRELTNIKPGAALTALPGARKKDDEPKREIDKLTLNIDKPRRRS